MIASQKRILIEVVARALNGDPPPSLRDLARAASLASVSTVQEHVEALCAAGYLEREPLRSRTLRPSNRYRYARTERNGRHEIACFRIVRSARKANSSDRTQREPARVQ